MIANSNFNFQSKAEENGLDAHALVNLSQAELAMRMGSDAAMLGGWKKKFKGKVRNQNHFYVVIFIFNWFVS